MPSEEGLKVYRKAAHSIRQIGQPESVHLVSADGQSVALDHRIGYAWNTHGQIASVKSLAGEISYE